MKKQKFNNHAINSKTHISAVTVDNCKNNYIGEMFFISMGQVGGEGRGEGFTGAWSIFRVGRKYK